MKNFTTQIAGLITLVSIVLFTTLSCKKENSIMEPIKAIDLGDLSDRDAFAVYQNILAPLHSSGIEYIFKQIKKNHENINKIDELTDEFMKTSSVTDIIKDYAVNYLDDDIKNKDQANKEIESLNKFCYDFVDKIHEGTRTNLSIDEVKKQTVQILEDTNFKSLSKARRHVILTAISVYEDSYAYWIKNLEAWEDETGQEPAGLSIWGRIKQLAKADMAGAVGGAIGGAVVGSFAGGVGAGPGAVGGAVGGAITNSVTSALN